MEENKETGGRGWGRELRGKRKMSGTKRGGGKKSQRRIRSVCAPRSFSSMFVLIVADRCSPPLEAGAPPPLLPPLLLELICWTAHGRGKNSPRGSGRGRGKSSLTNLQRAQQRGDKPLSLRDQPAFHSQGWMGNREGSISLCWRCCLLSRARHRDEIFEEIASRFEGRRNRIFE